MKNLSPLFAAALATMVVGCSKPPTVSEFLADPELLKATMAKCNENPGDFLSVPECTNVKAADRKQRAINFGKALNKGQFK